MSLRAAWGSTCGLKGAQELPESLAARGSAGGPGVFQDEQTARRRDQHHARGELLDAGADVAELAIDEELRGLCPADRDADVRYSARTALARLGRR